MAETYTMQDLAEDITDLVATGLVAVSGPWHQPRYCLTPEGQQAIAEAWQPAVALRRFSTVTDLPPGA